MEYPVSYPLPTRPPACSPYALPTKLHGSPALEQPSGQGEQRASPSSGCCPVCQGRPRFHPGPIAAPPFCLLGGSSRPGPPLPPGAEWYFLAVQLGGSPLQGNGLEGHCISFSGCRQGCLLHRPPLARGVSLVPQGLAPGPCAPVPRPASCSPHRVFSILYVTGWCTTK